VLASVGCVALTYVFGRLALGPAAGLGAALMLAVVPWHVGVSREGLREECALLFVYGLAVLVLLRRTGGRGRALLAGALAAAAVLTRLDAGAVVAFLLLVWSVRQGPRRRHALASWGVFVLLLLPLLVGYRLRTGEALAPLGTSMGGDIRASMTPLLRGDIPAPQVLRYFAAGTVEMYRGTIFSGIAAYAGPAAGIALALLLAAFVAGLLLLLWRGPRLPVALALLGTYAPPFAYIAGIAVLGGPGQGYTERYTYLIIPAVLAICAWSASRFTELTAIRLRSWLPTGRAGPGPVGDRPSPLRERPERPRAAEAQP
jgi:hypothetical protein